MVFVLVFLLTKGKTFVSGRWPRISAASKHSEMKNFETNSSKSAASIIGPFRGFSDAFQMLSDLSFGCLISRFVKLPCQLLEFQDQFNGKADGFDVICNRYGLEPTLRLRDVSSSPSFISIRFGKEKD
jgi:hypothetical protein